MVSTRRSSHGPNTGEDLAIRAKDSPDVRILRDGTLHGPVVQERANKRRRTAKDTGNQAVQASASGSASGQGRAETNSESVPAEEHAAAINQQSPEDEQAKIGDTIEVADERDDQTDQGQPSSKRKRAPASGTQANGVAPPPASASSHRRFGSEDPEEPVTNGVNGGLVDGSRAEEENSEGDDDDDAAPEEVTTSSKLVQHLPSLPQPKRKTKKRKLEKDTALLPELESAAHEHNEDINDDPPLTALETPKQNQQANAPETVNPIPMSVSSSSSNPSFITAPEPRTPFLAQADSPPDTASSPPHNTLQLFDQTPHPQHIHPPRPTKKTKQKQHPPHPKKDIHIPSRNLTIRHLDTISDTAFGPSTTTTTSQKHRNHASLPMKVNKQSQNMRDQLLHRNRNRNRTKTSGAGAGAGAGFNVVTKTRGFLVR